MIASLFGLLIAQREPAYVLKGQSHGHTFVVRFEQAKFRIRGRKIVWVRHGEQGEEAYYTIGLQGKTGKRFIWGRDDNFKKGEIAKTIPAKVLEKDNSELSNLKVTVDGKRWPVARSLYDDLLNPDFGKEYEHASISRDGKTLRVSMEGADGAAGYKTTWTFRQGGKTKRTIESTD